MRWIDTHSHLDASEFERNGLDAGALIAQSAIENVALSVIPAVERSNFETVRKLAHAQRQAYGLGIHPLCMPQAIEGDLQILDQQLAQHRDDPRLVAVGEIGLDFFIPALCTSKMREKQTQFYRVQLKIAKLFFSFHIAPARKD